MVRLICFLVISLCPLSVAIAGERQDACIAAIPTSLATILLTKYPEFRLPLFKDGDPTQIQWGRKHGRGGCVLVAVGDFDGNSLSDLVILLPHKLTQKVMLVSALRQGQDWSIFELPTWCDSISSCYVGTGRPGKYEMTESFDYTTISPNSREKIVSQNRVIVSGTPESTGIVHAFIRERWLYVWVSD